MSLGSDLREFCHEGPALTLRAAVLPLERARAADLRSSLAGVPAADRRGLGRDVIRDWASRQATWLEGAELAHACPSCGSAEHGQPRLVRAGRTLPAALSYTRAEVVWPPGEGAQPLGESGQPGLRWAALVLMAFRPDAGELPAGFGVGVDLEPNTRRSAMEGDGWREFAYSPREQALLRAIDREQGESASNAAALRLWVRKEALVKASGTGLRVDPARIPGV